MLNLDTIVAPVTPPGEGGVGIVRLSGPQAVTYLKRSFRSKTKHEEFESHRLYYGQLFNADEVRLDEVLAVVMRSPRSYTGEDVVEVHCHGGIQIIRSVLDLFLAAGARMAAPGEFTQRAFLHGRLDLSQAEAVVDVIKARSERSGQVALDQLEGHLSRKIYAYSDQLKSALALLEAHIDFPDDEVGSLDLASLVEPFHAQVDEMVALANSFDVGRVLREGVSILILGRPNVGKSSLMNALLGEARAIVTEVAGTTRDTLEESLVLAGFPVRLIDAAGVRETDDPVEKEGVRRASSKARIADLILLVVDGSTPLNAEDHLAIDQCQIDKTIVVVNKDDQPQSIDFSQLKEFSHKVSVSAKQMKGLDSLCTVIAERLGRDSLSTAGEGLVVTEKRHKDALLRAITSLNAFFEGVHLSAPYECLAMDLREGLNSLGLITGETTPDEILDQIFSRFCIGK
jgi:tRNA modification GTPase